jgi:hypothetical protein
MPRQLCDERTPRLRRYWDQHARDYDRQKAFWSGGCSATAAAGSAPRPPATSRSLMSYSVEGGEP